MSNSSDLNPDKAQHVVRPDLGPNCLQRLSAEDITLADKELTLLIACIFSN